MEAAEIAALYLDISTRENLNRSGFSTGALARSWKAVFLKNDNDVITGAGAYSNKPYAGIHETGGVIRPKKAKAPLTPEGRSAGSPRNMSGLRLTSGLYGGPPRLAGGVPAQIHFVLPKQVTIPSTGYITIAAVKAQPEIEKIIGKSVYDVFST